MLFWQGTCQADKNNVYSGAGCEMCPGVNKKSGETWMATCGIGYQDRSCSLCSEGHFFTFGRCYSCPGGGANLAFTVGVVVFLVALWIVINTKVTGRFWVAFLRKLRIAGSKDDVIAKRCVFSV